MTAKERLHLQRLEIENRELREKCDKHLAVYRDQLIEIIELRTKVELIETVLRGDA